ncbi:ThuA domain-containing protein [Dokdonia sp. PRO95]|uniref:ThuA domain-containing protein n=1 Tax=Dokdonia sp. PRO95 TaxID=1239415 RepID=UPI000556198E|nr:ThuA domain-containing protein [Dokdonia sp. PRO95]
MHIKMLLKISFCILFITSCNQAEDKKQVIDEPVKQLRALIVDGQNNHGVWPKTTMMMKSYLEETGLFQVDIYRTAYTYQGPHHGIVDGLNHDSITQLVEKYRVDDARIHEVKDSIIADASFKPEFNTYDVILSNFGDKTANWPEDTKEDFESYMKNGGGLVVVHGANNSWGDWPAFNKMIGVGGWGNRPHDGLNQIYINKEEQLKIEPSNGEESSHGPETEFVLTAWDTLHPIMRGLPKQWMHTKDELYDRLRGPAKNVNVLYYAYSDVEGNAQPWAPENKGSGRGEPLIMTVNYESGRVFHTALGHMDISMESVGFITTLQRGAEWAATGRVTQEVPRDFPKKKSAVKRSWK